MNRGGFILGDKVACKFATISANLDLDIGVAPFVSEKIEILSEIQAQKACKLSSRVKRG
jgi:hypothetical protein